MPHVHLKRVQQQHHSRQAQSQQQHQANQAPSVSFVAAPPSEQPQALGSPPGSSSLPSQEQPLVSPNQQQHLQPCQPQESPDFQQQQQQSSQQSQNESESQPQSTGGSSAAATSQNSDGRKISCEDIQLVQNLIERCLQLYMNQGEVINTLLNQAKIEPGFTSLVWLKLEEQNPDFFKAYYTRLKLKKHITLFNHLLDQQVQLMQKTRMLPTKTPLSSPVPNYPSVQGVTIGFPIPQQSPVTVPGHINVASVSASPQSPFLLHGELHMQDSFQSSHESSRQSGLVEMEVPSVLHSSGADLNSDLQLGPNSASANGGAFPFNPITTSLDMLSIGIGLSTPMPLDTSFCTQDPHVQNVMSLSFNSADGDGNGSRDLHGALGHLPRNFSLSDLTADLGSHSDLGSFGNYSSPFATLETENFLQSPDKENYDDSKLLDVIEEPLNMEFSDLK